MWATNNKDLSMAEGDWGIELPIEIKGVTFSNNDVLRFTFKTNINGEVLLSKEYTPTQNKVGLIFTESETGLFPAGTYFYCLDWYQNGVFLCNIIPYALLRVVDKA